MRILKNIFLFLLLASASISNAQLTVSAEGGEAANSQNLEVDVMASEFNTLTAFEFNVVWDSLVMTFVEVKNLNATLVSETSYSVGTNFGLPGDGSILDGTLSTSWFNINGPVSLDGDQRLFTIVLNAIGADCASSSIDFENLEAGGEVFGQPVESSSTAGEILVSGADCGGGSGNDECVNECEGSDAVILSMPCITAPAGTNICIPITVYNFIDIEAVQTGIVWDPAVMEYTGETNRGFTQTPNNNPNAGFIFNANDSANGMVRQYWDDQTGNTPQTLPDGATLYELCFDLIGEDGDMTTIDFEAIGNFGVEIVQLGLGVEVCVDPGKITIGEEVGDPVQLIANDVSGSEDGEACVDITVREFINIRGYQANLQWDDAIIQYNRVQMLNSDLGLTVSNFNATSNPANLRFTFDNLTPATLDNDTKLFQVCFDVIGDCTEMPTSPVTFESTATSDIEFSDPDGMALPFMVTNGSVSVQGCGHSCSLVGASQPTCPGDDGSITVTVEADATCECNWYLNGGTSPIQTTPGNGNCNLSAVGAGNYTFELTDATGAVVCTFDQAITDPSTITTNPSVSNAGCGDTGSITLNATGGSGTLSYTWVPNVSTTDSATDLPAGDYTIMIFDDNDCSVSVMRTVTSDLDPLSFDANSTTVVDPTCNGSSDGSISGAAMGGCPPYTFAYEGGDGTGLLAGAYGVTVTDSNGNTADGSVTLTDPVAITLTASVVNESDNMMNGSITIASTGMAPFTYMWSPDVSASETASNLSAGLYDVTVTDANGCTAFESGIEVINVVVGTDLTVGAVSTIDVVSCFGDPTGSISSSFVGGTGPYTIDLSGESSATMTLASSGTFSFDGLMAGTYSITVTDNTGATDSALNIEINEPEDLEATVTKGDDFNNCDGFIDVVISGGTAPYTYQWVNQDWDTPSVSNVCAGSYDLIVTDANGCVLMLMTIEIIDRSNPNGPCWVPRNIITPNDDDKNDFFTFTCINDRVAALQIFDRYGREVYTNDNYDNSFNGISNSGVELGQGGYMWVLNIDFGAQGRQVEQGTLTLLRD